MYVQKIRQLKKSSLSTSLFGDEGKQSSLLIMAEHRDDNNENEDFYLQANELKYTIEIKLDELRSNITIVSSSEFAYDDENDPNSSARQQHIDCVVVVPHEKAEKSKRSKLSNISPRRSRRMPSYATVDRFNKNKPRPGGTRGRSVGKARRR